MKVHRLKIKKKYNLYSNIDWNKTSVLFQRPLQQTKTTHFFPSTREILHTLGSAADKGMIFLLHGNKPGVEAVLLGERSYDNWRAKKTISQLSSQKYVSIEELANGQVKVKITKHGLARALTYELDSMKLLHPNHWDKKWRVIIFDIPEKDKRVRDIFRARLQQLGLYLLQESVYISPYPCFDEVEFLRELYGVAITVKYLLVEKLEDDLFLKNYFNIT